MKKLMFALVLIFGASMVQAQTKPTNPPATSPGKKMEKAETTKKAENPDKSTTAVLKPHACTAACKNGKHIYAHGEEGHKCTTVCRAMGKTKTASKPAKGTTTP